MIKKIVIEIQGKEIELTPQEAVVLKNDLDKLIGDGKNVLYPLPYYEITGDTSPGAATLYTTV